METALNITSANTGESLEFIVEVIERKLQTTQYKHQSNNIDDIDGFGLQIFDKILTSLKTLISICNKSKDYPAACNLLRMIADSLSTYKLIYSSKDIEEKKFRHYLYVLDGITSRKKLMQNDISNDGTLSVNEFKQLLKQYESTRQSDNDAIKHCNEKLNNHIYSQNYPEFHKLSINKCNWRYKDKVSSSINKNRYSWGDMYRLLGLPNYFISFISLHLSQYSHGLCVSNLIHPKGENDFTPILSFGIIFAGKLINEIDPTILR